MGSAIFLRTETKIIDANDVVVHLIEDDDCTIENLGDSGQGPAKCLVGQHAWQQRGRRVKRKLHHGWESEYPFGVNDNESEYSKIDEFGNSYKSGKISSSVELLLVIQLEVNGFFLT